MSLSMRLTTAALGLFPKSLASPETLFASLRNRPEPAPIPRSLRRSHVVTKGRVDGFPVLTLTPRRRGSGIEVIYLHGGAYVNPMIWAHWSILDRIARLTGATITVPYYGLAPEHTVDEAYPLLDNVYDAVQQRAGSRPVFLAGDSAGAGLALGQAIHLRDNARTAPQGVFLFSPWLDVSMSNPSIPALIPVDPMLAPAGLVAAGEAWAGTRGASDPLVSPIEDRLVELPPIYIYQGGKDIFLADAQRIAQMAKAAGAPLELRVYPQGFHVFVAAWWTPEAGRAMRHLASIMTSHQP